MDFPRIESRVIGLDYETTGLDYWADDFRMFGIAVATADQEWYFDTRTAPGAVQWLRDLLPGRKVIAHNAQYEYQVTRTCGIDPRSIEWYCTMVAECLIFEHDLEYGLEAVARRRGIESKKSYWLDQIQAAMGLGSHAAVLAALDRAPSALVECYGSGDARLCFDIWKSQQPDIVRDELQRVLQMEMELLPVLADMSWGGVRVNLEAAHAAIPKLDAKEKEIAARIAAITGAKDPAVFVNSPKQMREFFKPEQVNKYQWRLIDGTLVGPTKGGTGPSLGQDALRQIQHPLAAEVLDLRKTIKLRDTFIRGHVIGSADGRGYVHTQFNQTRNDADAGTVTGRLSSTGPALQQITKRDKANAAILRSLFLPDPGEEWVGIDYNQVDFKMAAHLINDPRVIAAYAANPRLDYHQIVSDMTGIPRNPAYAGAPNTKTLNLSLAFGAGAGKIAHSMGMPYEIGSWKGRMVYYPGPEARKVFEEYHHRVPGVSAFSKKAEHLAKTRGYVKTLLGRRLRFQHGYHKAAGLLFQAYAADVNKMGLIAVDSLIRSDDLPCRMLLTVHDEVCISSSEATRVAPDLESSFCSPGKVLGLRVPVTADTSVSETWGG